MTKQRLERKKVRAERVCAVRALALPRAREEMMTARRETVTTSSLEKMLEAAGDDQQLDRLEGEFAKARVLARRAAEQRQRKPEWPSKRKQDYAND